MTQIDTPSTMDELWEAGSRRLPELTAQEQHAGLVLLRELANGEPVQVDQLAHALGSPSGDTRTLLEASQLRPFIHAGDDGRVVGFWGLSTVPMHHRFAIDGRTLWTWCALDSLFLPELLGTTAAVEFRDPESGEPVRLTLSPSELGTVEPRDLVVSMNSPEAWETTSAERVIATACHYIFFFASRSSGESWVARHPRTTLLSLEEAFLYGRRQNRRMFGEKLARRNGVVR